MLEPLDAVTAIHNAFRHDIDTVDAAALDAARGKAGSSANLERFRFLNEILVWHAKGEELAIFPALDGIAPLLSELYITDHHKLDASFDALNAAVAARDLLEAARASAVFKFHLHLHLDKEDAQVYKILKERLAAPDQGKAAGLMSSTVPRERFPDVVAWMFPIIGDDDRATLASVWQTVMPAPMFATIKPLIQKAVGSGWAEMTKRNPALLQ